MTRCGELAGNRHSVPHGAEGAGRVGFRTGRPMDADGVLIDTESVITEVHARPQIWNPAHELFKNVEARRQAWLDVTRAVVYNLPEFDRANQKFLERKVHMRWRTARDSYVKARATLAAGRCERRERRYGYYENMRFIDPALRRPTPAAGGKRPTPAAGGKRPAPAAGGKRPTPAAGGKRASPLDEDDDNFFKSLAPVLRTFDAHRKLAFRSRVLALALEVQADIFIC